MVEQVEGTVATNSGLFLLWNPERFRAVVDYDTWEAELLEDEDIGRHVAAGAAVPVNIGSDGAFQMVVRVGSAAEQPALTERETRYRVVASEPYLLISDGAARLTGIEDVRIDVPEAGLTVPVPPGRWSVVVHLIAWDEEPGVRDASGRPSSDALPDFILLITPEGETKPHYRETIETFPPAQ